MPLTVNTPPNKVTRATATASLREKWTPFGCKLFDIMSQDVVIRCSKNGQCFDESFYHDQKSDRKLQMLVTKVTKEYAEQEQRRMKQEAVKQSRLASAYANFDSPLSQDSDSSDSDELDMDDSFVSGISANTTPISTSSTLNIMTRKRSGLITNVSPCVTHQSTQTDKDFSQRIPLRIERVKGSGIFANVEPRYLEAMSLLMSENLSASEAVKAVHIIDTVVWGQVRHLPLRLEKHYMNSFKLLKKFNAKQAKPLPVTVDISNNTISDQVLSSEEISVQCITPSDTSDRITTELQKTVQSYIDTRKNDMGNTLPDPNCVRHNHNLLSVYCEGRVANEIVQKKAFILPDGTSRQGVGELAAAVVKVGTHIRALKSLQIKGSDRENWAKAIYHMLDRLATASSSEVSEIWRSIVAMVTDLCKVNINLAEEVKQLTGTAWLPGQAFCNLHFTLAIPVGIKKILGRYQSIIGADKMLPKNVSFEMNI